MLYEQNTQSISLLNLKNGKGKNVGLLVPSYQKKHGFRNHLTSTLPLLIHIKILYQNINSKSTNQPYMFFCLNINDTHNPKITKICINSAPCPYLNLLLPRVAAQTILTFYIKLTTYTDRANPRVDL